MVILIFDSVLRCGFTLRLFRGFNDVTSASGTYYQLWSGGKGTVNTGSTGLGNFGECLENDHLHLRLTRFFQIM